MELVAPAGPVYQAGTLSANPVGMRAGLATLQKIERVDAYEQLEQKTKRFCDRLNNDLRQVGLAFEVTSAASIFWIHLKSEAPIRRLQQIPPGHAEKFAQVFHAALGRGVYLPPSGHEVCFMSLAHSDELLDDAHNAILEAVKAAA
jgi:glutamate-1-semialdehyde 2,1-aminomutase